MTEEQRTNREISNANLIHFQPNESGNPGGRPKGKSITAELRKLIDQGDTAKELADILYIMSRKDLPALKELLDRTDGKVTDVHKIEGDIPVSIVYKQVKEKDVKGTGQEGLTEGIHEKIETKG